MGAEVSIINDTSDVLQAEVWTLGEVFMVETQCIRPGLRHSFKLMRVPYTLIFKVHRHGEQKAYRYDVQAGYNPIEINVSVIIGPGKSSNARGKLLF